MQPQKIDLLLHCRWLIPIIPKDQVLENVSVAINSGRILDLLPQAQALQHYSPVEEVSLDQHIVMPGLVNAHCQSSKRLLRGHTAALAGKTGDQKVLDSAGSSIADSNFIRDGNVLAMAEMIKTGVTSFVDMCFPHEILIDTVRNVGLRCQISFEVYDHPTAFAHNAEEHIHKGLSLYDKVGEYPLLKVACAPHDLNNLSDGALKQISTYANELDMALHIPCHISANEIVASQTKYGCRPLNRLNHMGLLLPQTRLVYMNQVNAEDIQLLTQSNAHVINCGLSNPEACEGLSPINQLRQEGINIALGTGGLSVGGDLNLLAELKTFTQMATLNGKSNLESEAQATLRSATINGAIALGWEQQIGSLEIGKFADIIAIEIDPITQQPLYNPHLQLINSSKSSQVSHNWVAGRPLMIDKRLVNLNEQQLGQMAADWQAKLVQ